MSIAQHPPVTYAPRGVVNRPIALRLLAPELAQHETLAKQAGCSSASFARQVYLRGIKSIQRAAAVQPPAQPTNIGPRVNRA